MLVEMSSILIEAVIIFYLVPHESSEMGTNHEILENTFSRFVTIPN